MKCYSSFTRVTCAEVWYCVESMWKQENIFNFTQDIMPEIKCIDNLQTYIFENMVDEIHMHMHIINIYFFKCLYTNYKEY